ncbi:MAG: TSUP family transporter [Alphaproteobacteria bacterium]|nr:TSUP family transporter [Alphaproteobacteria bacterium]
MSPLLVATLCAVMVGTSFLSGIFGMAGGLILAGILLALLPVPDAMMLHGVTQMASNGWRALLWYRHVRWRTVAAYAAGCIIALAVWSFTRYVPERPMALLLLGLTPFAARLVPPSLRPDPDSAPQGALYGVICTTLMLLTGVTGPLLDAFFLGGKLGRREIVASKSTCMVFSHALKLVYFGGIIDQAGSVDPVMAALAILASITGTSLAARVLEALTDHQFRVWANRIITVICGYYVLHGTVLLALSWTAAR